MFLAPISLALGLLSLVSAAKLPFGDFNTTVEKRGETRYVFMHHIVGNTYPYTKADWAEDIKAIAARGVDAIALNYGADSWQLNQIASAYDAAAALKTPLKLFLSPDFTAHSCDLSATINEIKRFAGHSSQFKVNGKPLVSSFEGGCLGEAGWERLKAETNAWLMPFISGLEGKFGQWGVLDTWFCWGCAWPNGDIAKTTADDNYYMSQLGTRYATTVSPWLYTHYNYKNFLQKSDDWLFLTRWDQLMAMRDKLTFVEMISWNDYGESHYLGPLRGAEPSGTTWTNGFPHIAWFDLSAYYIHAFKTGSYPDIKEDVVYYWARPHPASSRAKNDPLGPPQGWDWVSDTLWAAAFLTSPGTVTLSVGSSSKTFTNVPKGVSRLSIPLAPGQINVKVERNGRMIVSGKSDGYTYTLNPVTYNFNVWVGAAKGGAQPPSPSPTTSSSHTSTTSTPTPTPSAPSGWTHAGCYPDTFPRLLPVFGGSSLSMTPTFCTNLCAAKGFVLAGTEFGIECYCASTIVKKASMVPQGECNMPCYGDKTKTCGAVWRMDLYVRKGASTVGIDGQLGLPPLL